LICALESLWKYSRCIIASYFYAHIFLKSQDMRRNLNLVRLFFISIKCEITLWKALSIHSMSIIHNFFVRISIIRRMKMCNFSFQTEKQEITLENHNNPHALCPHHSPHSIFYFYFFSFFKGLILYTVLVSHKKKRRRRRKTY
jgi:hypothetical protein